MYLIQVLLPLFSNSGRRFPGRHFAAVKEQLTARFKGLTAYNRAPAEGRWKKSATVRRDDIIIYEVMAPRLETKWWQQYKRILEKQFRQETVVVRAHQIRLF